MKAVYITLLVLTCIHIDQLRSQQYSEINTPIVINESDGDVPDSSAILELSSTSKGILIPRMTLAERNAISDPELGLLVYVTSTGSFSFYDGGQWQNLLFIKSSIHDQDDDTLISVEEGDDTDQIVIYAADKEVLHLDTTALQLHNDIDFIIANSTSGSGKKIIWDNSNASFRAGEITGTQWDVSEIGRNSVAFGLDNIADGINSMSWGESNSALRTNSTAWGDGTISEGGRSTAWGSKSKASGNNATAWGASTEATKSFATAWGNGSKALEISATAWGRGSDAIGLNSTVWGNNTDSRGENTTAWGRSTIADSINATAWGNGTEAIGVQATAWGNNTEVIGDNGTAWGNFSKATNHNSTAWGDASIASGINTTAWGNEARAMGKDATAWNFAFAIGEGSTAFNGGTAIGKLSTAIGFSVPKSYMEISIGHNGTNYTPIDTFNWAAQDRIFSVGAGSPTTSKNAITILKNGNIGIVIDTPQHLLHIQDSNAVNVVIRSENKNAILNIDGKDSTVMAFQNNGIDNYSIIGTPGKMIFKDTLDNTPLTIEDHGININGTGGQDLTVFQSSDSTGITLANGANVWTYSSSPATELILRQGPDVKGMFDLSGMYFPISDRKLKKDIKTVSGALHTIQQLRPVHYKMKNSSSDQYTGFIAQEVQDILPHMVKYNENNDLYTMNYDGLTAINLKAIQELSDQVQLLQEHIKLLQSQVEKLSKND